MRQFARICACLFGMTCAVGLFGSDLGLRADLRDVRLGLACSIVQPITISRERDGTLPASPQYSPGMRLQFSASAPLVERIALRSGVAIMRFSGRNGDHAPRATTDTCDDISFESDFLVTLFRHGPRASTYGIVGASIDFLHYFGTRDGAFSYDHRTTNNAITLGIGRSQRSGEKRYMFEVVFHKALVYDVAQSLEFPRIDRIELSYGVIF